MVAKHWTLPLLLIASALCGCERPAVPPRLVLLYATCTVNADVLGPYSPEITATHAFDRLAKDGVVFERHQTESGQSGVAFASLFSGNHADRHGVYVHPSPIQSDTPLITEAFAKAGWEVHTWLQHQMANAELGYAAGAPPENQHPVGLEADDERFLQLLKHLREDPKARAFVATNFTVTHSPYLSWAWPVFCERDPERCTIREHPDYGRLRKLYHDNYVELSYDFDATTKRLGLDQEETELLIQIVNLVYEGTIVQLDLRLRDMLQAIDDAGLADETILAVTADHGETRFVPDAPFQWTHGFRLATDVLNVPMILRAPGVPPGRYEGVTRSIDVYPTLAGLAGLPPVGDVTGTDLSSALRGEAAPPDLSALSHTALPPPMWWPQVRDMPRVREVLPGTGPRWLLFGLRKGDTFFELSHDGKKFAPKAFDIASDPGKTRDIYDPTLPEHASVHDELLQAKLRFARRQRELNRNQPRIPSENQAERLRALGYIR